MGIHHLLHALGERLGTRVFDDSESFRGALDDYLDEGAATTGEINLLVDTVRLGAYQRLTAMINGGADPGAAVATAGDLLARERGSADVEGSRWACAVLGFAAGKVPEGVVDRYYTGTIRRPGQSDDRTGTQEASHGSPPAGGASPAVPPTAPAPPRGQAPRPPRDQVPPTAQVGRPPQPGTGAPGASGVGAGVPAAGMPRPGPGVPMPGAGGGMPGPPRPGAGGGSTPPYGQQPVKKSRWGLVIAAVVVILALLAGGGWWLASGDEDEPRADDPTPDGPSDTPSDPPTSPTDPPVDPLSVTEVSQRYAGLAPAFDGLLTPCTSTTPAIGETEHLNCNASNGAKIELVTFDSGSSLQTYRDYVVDNGVGSVYSSASGRTYYSEDPAGAKFSSIYWDDSGVLQSARLQHSSLKELKASLATIDAVVSPPTKPSDDGLRTVIAENIPTLNRCTRLENVHDGQTEANRCRDGKLYVYYSHYVDRKALVDYRGLVQGISKSNDGETNPWFYKSTPNAEEGKRIEWIDAENDYAHLYWDVESCLCSIEAIALNDNQGRLYDWWLNAE